MEVIRQESQGPQVQRWQFFLVGLGYKIVADGDFGPKTHAATVDFQQMNGLTPDGIVGLKTYLQAFRLGYRLQEAFDYPKKPDFKPLSYKGREKLFGKFRHKPANDGTDAVIILGDWERQNIVTVDLPQLAGVKGALPNNRVRFHKKAANQLKALFIAWENEGLLPLILTWEGSYVPRYIRGSRTRLSNHAYGSAFDINYAWNRLGQVPALVGEKGAVRELVTLAHKHGFYWGGHFNERLDGMHFEVAKIV